MCLWGDSLKTTFDMIPWVSHCPQLSPASRGKTIQSISPPERLKLWPPPFHSITRDSTCAKSPHKWDWASAIFFVGVNVSVSEKMKTSKAHERAKVMDGQGGGGAWHERRWLVAERLIKGWWLLMGQWLNHWNHYCAIVSLAASLLSKGMPSQNIFWSHYRDIPSCLWLIACWGCLVEWTQAQRHFLSPQKYSLCVVSLVDQTIPTAGRHRYSSMLLANALPSPTSITFLWSL